MGYLPGMWHDFGVTIGSLAGALTGLLFVAVSIKSDTFAGVTFLVTAGGGLYWLIPAAVVSLVGGVINAWLFLVRA